MRMKLISRRDRVLLAGFAIALVVVFAKPVNYLLDVARDVEQSSGLALVEISFRMEAMCVFSDP